MTTETGKGNRRLIEQGFPCHQVGAETQRERGASSALPPLYFLHVWWARRPLTPSRAAILASLAPSGTDPEIFVRSLGIEKIEALVNGVPWTLTGDLLGMLTHPHPLATARTLSRDAGEGWGEGLPVDDKVLRRLQKENERRAENRKLIARLENADPALGKHPVLLRWEAESQPIPKPWPQPGEVLEVRRVMGDPAAASERIAFENSLKIRTSDDKYGYGRAFSNLTSSPPDSHYTVGDEEGVCPVILDPTAGGGSIPFEALRLGHSVVANELNPVAVTILYATLDYPARFGRNLTREIEGWGRCLREKLVHETGVLFPASSIPSNEEKDLRGRLKYFPDLIARYLRETLDGFLWTRQVTCPHCGGEAPLLYTCWLSKQDGDPWGVKIVTDGKRHGGTVHFETYRVVNGCGPKGEDPNVATVAGGVGTCIHCKQAIPEGEIKAQARGESARGRWIDRLYAVVAVRLEPKIDKHGRPERFKSGGRKGELRTRKVRFFRPPNGRDLKALDLAEARLQEKWPAWEAAGLIPTEQIPKGHKTNEPLRYGMSRWCDLFTPRQLLGHLTLIEQLNRLRPEILAELGPEKGRAVVTYLQFAIDKGIDYNSRQTRWIPQRASVSGTFGRHDFSLKWTFGEMIFTGPNSGAAWGLSQVIDAYEGIAELIEPVHRRVQDGQKLPLTITFGTAAHMAEIRDASVDLVCMDPPYYNNVQYGELSDYFYVWQRRTLADLYPGLYQRRLVNKQDEAVANPARGGSSEAAKATYERMMAEIFAECRRVMKDNSLMTLMFSHKSHDAWEALTRSLIEAGWTITASVPVDTEFGASMHQLDKEAAGSAIFLTCRKRAESHRMPAAWIGLGGSGVQHRIRDAVEAALQEFAPLALNPVDEMVACYGRALHVLSEQWPVMDGNEPVGPLRAMNEASRVVAENQIRRITKGRLSVDDLDPETAMALTLYGIYGLNAIPFDEALNLSRSLNIALTARPRGYRVEGRMIGVNQVANGRRAQGGAAEDKGYPAPLARNGSKLQLTWPEERDPRRLAEPQTDWDILHGLLQAFRRGDVPVARAYLQSHADDRVWRILDLLDVWAAEATEPNLKQEAEALRFGLQRAAA